MTTSRRYKISVSILLISTSVCAATGLLAQSGPAVTGLVVASQQATLSTRMPARIARVIVAENQSVQRGQLLIQLDDADFRSQLSAAQAAVRSARSQKRKAEDGARAMAVKAEGDVQQALGLQTEAHHKRDQAEINVKASESESAADIRAADQAVSKARTGLEAAEKALVSLEALEKAGGVSRNDIDAARTQKRLAQTDLESALSGAERARAGIGGVPFRVVLAKKDLEAARLGATQADDGLRIAKSGAARAIEVADNDVISARSAVNQADAAAGSAAIAVASMQLRTPIDGVITTLSARTGEVAQPGMPLASIVSSHNVHLEALVPARYISGLAVGKHVRVQAETVPGKPLDAVVYEISSVVESDQRSIRVKFRPTGTASLRPGLAVRITIGASS